MSEIFAVLDTPMITASMNMLTINSLSEINNVDTSVLENGSVLVFKTITNTWISTTTLEEQNLEGGHY